MAHSNDLFRLDWRLSNQRSKEDHPKSPLEHLDLLLFLGVIVSFLYHGVKNLRCAQDRSAACVKFGISVKWNLKVVG